jgi:tRNA(Ile)-lysidine synthase
VGEPGLRARFRQFVVERDLLRDGESVVVGVSGGVDSVALLALLRERHRPLAVHVDYGLRVESPADAAFVKELGSRLGIEVVVQEVHLPQGQNRQATARRTRYEVFERVAQERGIHTVAVAHHRDDVAETLLLHLIRGTGPGGWAAMPVSRPIRRGGTVRLIRPLRLADRAEIEAFARAEGLQWREDRSNASLRYRRNIIRNEVLPLLEARFGPGVAARLADAAERMEAYREAGASLASDTAFESTRVAERSLDLAALSAWPEPVRLGIILEALRQWAPNAPRTSVVATTIAGLLDAQPGRRVELSGLTVWRERDRLTFAEPNLKVAFEAPVAPSQEVEAPGGVLRVTTLDEVPHAFESDPNVELVDADRLRPPLTLRTWQQGDVLQPYGMEGRKSVSDLLRERGVPASARAGQLVLEARGEIIWVVGHRLGASVAVHPETRRAARLEWIARS